MRRLNTPAMIGLFFLIIVGSVGCDMTWKEMGEKMFGTEEERKFKKAVSDKHHADAVNFLNRVRKEITGSDASQKRLRQSKQKLQEATMRLKKAEENFKANRKKRQKEGTW